jgi:DNA-directed RNA polymerase specialized sigma24 family protein
VNVLARSDGLRANSKTGLLAWLFAVLRSTLTDHFRAEQRVRRKKSAFDAELATAPELLGPDELRSANACACC